MMSRSWKAPDWEIPARAAGNPPPHLAKSKERSQGGNGQICKGCKGCNESRARARFSFNEKSGQAEMVAACPLLPPARLCNKCKT